MSLHGHLKLSNWPFSVVPRPEECTFIAGRPQLKNEFDALVAAWARRTTSSIHIFWSWVGAGKTHSLYYLDNLARRQERRHVSLLPIYTEFPKGSRGFLDLYRAFMTAFDTGLLLDAFLEFQTGPTADRFYGQLSQSQPDLATALRVMAMGDSASKAIAQRWLKGDKLGAAELRTIGLSQRINSTQQATTLLSLVVSLLADAAKVRGLYGNRVVWLVDEFQRARKAGSAVLTDVNAGMHSLFNAAPDNLSIVFSFTGAPAASLPAWFSPELKDRIGLTKAFILPPLQNAEAIPFVRDVLQHYRIDGGSIKNDLFPFSKDACSAIFAQIESKGELRPRAIMNAFHVVLAAADEEIEHGRLIEIDSAFAKKALAEHINVAPTEEDE